MARGNSILKASFPDNKSFIGRMIVLESLR